MPISIELNDLFESNEKEKLKKLLKRTEEDLSETELENETVKIIKAAMCEYKQMFLGMGLPTRADEIQQYRLYYLIERYFKEMPTEEQVSSMFQLTHTKSRTLIRSVMTRFRYNLDQIISDNLKDILNNAELKEDNNCYFVIQSNYALEQFKNIIDNRAPTSDGIRRVANTSRTFYTSKSSYKTLCENFDMVVEFED